MITWDDFSREFAKLSDHMEQRRRLHLKFFYGCMAVLAVIWVAALFHSGSGLLYLIARLFGVSSLGFGGYIILLLGSLAWILFMIYNYRGTNGTAYLKPTVFRRFSLKDEVYSALFKLFGPVEYAPHGGVSLVETRKSTIFPHLLTYLPEDYAVARLHDMEAKLCEAKIARIVNKKRVSVFKGLLLVCDLSNVRIKLRGGFRGRTALINDAQKNVAELVKPYSAMKKFTLPDKFEPMLEGYTSDTAEATAIVTNDLLETLNTLAEQAKKLTRQKEHWDDKLAYAAEAAHDFWKEKIISTSIESEPDIDLQLEKAYDKKYATDLDITKADPISNDVSSLNNQFEVEFYEDKFIVTIPCRFDLFEVGSIFEPVLNEEDARFLYTLMLCVDKVTLHLSQVEP